MPKKDAFTPKQPQIEPQSKTPPRVEGTVRSKYDYALPTVEDSGLILNHDITDPGFYEFRKNALAYAWGNYYKYARPGAILTMPDGTVIQYGNVGDATATITVPGQPSFTVPRNATDYDLKVWVDGVDPVVAQNQLNFEINSAAYREITEAFGKNPVDLTASRRKKDWVEEWIGKFNFNGPSAGGSEKPPSLKYGLGDRRSDVPESKGPGGLEARMSYADWYQYIFNIEGPGGFNLYLGNRGKSHAGLTPDGPYAKFDNHTGLGLIAEPTINIGFFKIKPKVEAWYGPRVEIDEKKSKTSKRAGVKAEVQILDSNGEPVDNWITDFVDGTGAIIDTVDTVASFLGLSEGGLVSNAGDSVASATTRVPTDVVSGESMRRRRAKPLADAVIPDAFGTPMLRIFANGDYSGFGKTFTGGATATKPIIDSELNSFVQELEPNSLLRPMVDVIDHSARMMSDVTGSGFHIGNFTNMMNISGPRRTIYNFNGFESKAVSDGVTRALRRR